MSYKVTAIPEFEKDLKKLAQKFPSLKKEYMNLVQQLKQHPDIGTPLGSNCFKIRIAIASKGKGKRGGARVITYVYVTQSTVFLLSIYDKSEKSTISDMELKALLNTIK